MTVRLLRLSARRLESFFERSIPLAGFGAAGGGLTEVIVLRDSGNVKLIKSYNASGERLVCRGWAHIVGIDARG